MKPLCCIPVKPGLRFLSFIDVIVSAFLVVASIAAWVYYEEYHEDARKYLNNPPEYLDIFMNMRNVKPVVMRVLLAFCIFYYVQKLALAIIITVATFNESKFLIRLFVLYTLAILCIHALVFFTLLCFSMMELWSIAIYTAGFVFQEWHMWSATRYLDNLVHGTTDDQDDYYDFGSRRSSGDDEKYSYKL